MLSGKLSSGKSQSAATTPIKKSDEKGNTTNGKTGRSGKLERLKKAQSVFIPNQQVNYGPKACLKKLNEDMLLLIQDPLSHRLSWNTKPANVLLVTKRCPGLADSALKLIDNLVNKHGLRVYLEKEQSNEENLQKGLKKFNSDSIRIIQSNVYKNQEDLDHKIDLVICLGGDGTLLHVSSLFQRSCPPVLSFNMGSLGFLCPFDFENYEKHVSYVLSGDVPFTLRNRLSCRLELRTPSEDSPAKNSNNLDINENALVGDAAPKSAEWLSLNEVVIDRGSSPYLSNLDLFLNDYLVTTVQGDGLIISTPTGSTAYAMAAGASMCHPSVPAVIICPICPHSLSFRPIVVPAGIDLRISLGLDARNTASCSVDGHNIGQLKPGDSLIISSSDYPLPSICLSDQVTDWFEGLGHCLHWNQRKKQLPLDACFPNKD